MRSFQTSSNEKYLNIFQWKALKQSAMKGIETAAIEIEKDWSTLQWKATAMKSSPTKAIQTVGQWNNIETSADERQWEKKTASGIEKALEHPANERQ